MKLIGMLTLFVLPLSLLAQPETTDNSAETSLAPLAREIVAEAPVVSYDKIKSGNVTYSGIGVQLLQAEQPLQLLNPLAPKSYGSGEQNLVKDPETQRSLGLKFFAISF